MHNGIPICKLFSDPHPFAYGDPHMHTAAAKFRDIGARHFPSPSQSPLPSLSPPLQKSLVCRMVVASMPPPLVLSTLPPHLNAHRGSITSCPRTPLFPFASRLPAGCHVTCCRVPPPCFTFCCTAASCIHP